MMRAADDRYRRKAARLAFSRSREQVDSGLKPRGLKLRGPAHCSSSP